MTYLQRREVIFGLAGVALAQVMLGRAGAALAADKIKPSASSALIAVDVQNCFLPGGSLAVKDGDQVIPVINRIAKGFENVVMTQDWHPPHHMSFASSHPGQKPFDVIKVAYGDQVLWPDHCVQNTEGAQISKDMNISPGRLDHPQRLPQRGRRLLGFPRGGQADPFRAGELFQGARHRSGLSALPPTSASPGRQSMRAMPA